MERIALVMFKVVNHFVFHQFLVEVGQLIAPELIILLLQIQSPLHNPMLLVYQINIMIQEKNNVLMNKVGANLALIVGCMILVHNALNAQLPVLVLVINLAHNKLIVLT